MGTRNSHIRGSMAEIRANPMYTDSGLHHLILICHILYYDFQIHIKISKRLNACERSYEQSKFEFYGCHSVIATAISLFYFIVFEYKIHVNLS